MIQLLNPYSYNLKKNPLFEIDREPICKYGLYSIYKLYPDHFVYTYKNIVIMERTGENEKMLWDLTTDTIPENTARAYHDFDRPKEAIKNGLEIAKKIGFKVA